MTTSDLFKAKRYRIYYEEDQKQYYYKFTDLGEVKNIIFTEKRKDAIGSMGIFNFIIKMLEIQNICNNFSQTNKAYEDRWHKGSGLFTPSVFKEFSLDKLKVEVTYSTGANHHVSISDLINLDQSSSLGIRIFGGIFQKEHNSMGIHQLEANLFYILTILIDKHRKYQSYGKLAILRQTMRGATQKDPLPYRTKKFYKNTKDAGCSVKRMTDYSSLSSSLVFKDLSDYQMFTLINDLTGIEHILLDVEDYRDDIKKIISPTARKYVKDPK